MKITFRENDVQTEEHVKFASAAMLVVKAAHTLLRNSVADLKNDNVFRVEAKLIEDLASALNEVESLP